MAATAYIFWLALAELFFYVSGFIVHAAAGRILGPAEYGTYGIIITLTILIASLIGNGIPIAMSKFLSSALANNSSHIEAIKKKSALAQLILMSGVTLLFFLGAPFIASLLNDPTLVHLLRISALIIPCYAADSFYFYYYTGIHQFNMQSILKSLRSFLRVAIIVGLGYFLSLEGFITGYIYVSFVVFLIAYFIDKFIYAKKFKSNAKPNFEIKKLLIYALPITGFLIMYQAMISLDLFVVKALLKDDYLTGLFNGAFTISQIPNYLFYALTIVLLPVVSLSTAREDKEKTQKSIYTALRTMLMLLIPTITLIIAFSESLMVFFFGSQYVQGASALQFMAFGVGLLTLFYVMSFAFQGAGLTKIPLKIASIGMILNAIGTILLVKMLGLIGAGIATSIVAIIITILLWRQLKESFNVRIKFLSILKMLICAIIIFALAGFLPSANLMFILSSAILFSFYLFLLFMFGEITKEDLAMFKSLIPFFKKK